MIASPEKLPFLLELLDDDAPLVRQAVIRELSAFGPNLFVELSRLPIEITPKDKILLNQVLSGSRKSFLKRQWSSWFTIVDDHYRLETALTLLAEYQSGLEFKGCLKGMLDRLADEYKSCHSVLDVHGLAEFLFKEIGFIGAREDYYHPNNSNLIYVVSQRRGIPISLSCVYILIGHRLGFKIQGCNSPRHFLVIVDNGHSKELIDCFHKGRIIKEKEISTLSQEASLSLEEALRMQANSMDIVRRILANLIFSYQQTEQEQESVFMVHLLKEVQMFLNSNSVLSSHMSNEPGQLCFKIGQNVRHIDEGYRGLIVDYDLYYAGSNASHDKDEMPDYNQPWYKVLIDKADCALYVPHCQLESDLDNRQIENPHVMNFFMRTVDGVYVRNHMPWLE